MQLRAAVWMVLAIAAAIPAFSADLPGGAGGTSDTAREIRAITRPSGDVTLSFVRPGRIIEMGLDVGSAVTADQVVARQDDAEEKISLIGAKMEADDETEIKAERAVFAKDTADKQRFDENASASESEKREATLKVVVDEARIDLAIQKKKVAQNKYEQTAAAIEKLRLLSPISGVVAEVMLHVGEVTDGQNTKVMRIVQLDPLWVEVDVPTAQARKLSPKDPAQITFSDSKIREGRVAVVFPVGNSASKTIKVRVEVPNPQKLQSGENVLVTFGAANGVAAKSNP